MMEPVRGQAVLHAEGERVGMLPGSLDMAALRERLCRLVRDTLGDDVAIGHAPPRAADDAVRGVGLYWLDVGPTAVQSRQPMSLQFKARVLVTVHGPSAAAAGDDLAELLFAALSDAALEVDFEQLPMQAWTAFGLPPRPAFCLSAELRRSRQHATARPVREVSLRLHASAGALRGRLWAAGTQTPLGGARIELPDLSRVAATDASGAFAITSVPTGRALRLVATARGARAVFSLPAADGDWPFFPLTMSLPQQTDS